MIGHVVLALVVLAAGGSALALLAPFWALRQGADAAGRQARHAAISSAAAIAVMALAWLGWSFSLTALNVAAIVAALAGVWPALLFPFDRKPRRVWAVAGLLAIGGWLLAVLLALDSALFESNSPAWAELGNGLVCRDTVYGFVTSDTGEDQEVFRRYLFIDHRVYWHRESVEYPDAGQQPTSAMRALLARCQARVAEVRAVQAGVANQANRAYTPAVAPQAARGDTR